MLSAPVFASFALAYELCIFLTQICPQLDISTLNGFLDHYNLQDCKDALASAGCRDDKAFRRIISCSPKNIENFVKKLELDKVRETIILDCIESFSLLYANK